MRKSYTIRWFLLASLVFLGGCFPIELDVNSKGEMLIYRQEGFFLFHPATGKVTRITGAGGGVPVFARFSPNGKDVLCVVKDGRHIKEFRFDLVRLDGTGTRTLCRAEHAAYASFSPDGTQLAILHASKQKQPQLKQRKNEPVMDSTELEIVGIASGSERVLAQHLAVAFRWFRDGKRLLVFQFSDVSRDRHLGILGELDLASGAVRPLVAAVCPGAMMIDLSPDEQTILFTAHVAGKPGEKFDPDKNMPPARLYECNVKGEALKPRTAFSEETLFARYSPNGKKILLASPAKGQEIFSTKIALGVTDADWKKLTPLADNATEGQRGTAGGLAIPGWIDDDTIYYFVERTTYGTTGKSFTLFTVKADGSKKQLVQPVLDRGAFEALKAFPEGESPADRDPFAFPDRPPSEGGFRPGEDKRDEGNVTLLILGIGAGVVVLLGVVLFLVLRRPAAAGSKRPASRRVKDEGADEA
jgi:Tol biopolymer transport system component